MKVWSMKIMKYKAYIDSICVNFTEQQYKNYGIIPFLVLLHNYNRFMIISTLFHVINLHIILLSALL